jgi:hypothetical protein
MKQFHFRKGFTILSGSPIACIFRLAPTLCYPLMMKNFPFAMSSQLLAFLLCRALYIVFASQTGPAYEQGSATSHSFHAPCTPGLSNHLGLASSSLLIWSTSCTLQRQSSLGILSKTSCTLSLSHCSLSSHQVQVMTELW